jgi:hypothetical protein
VSRPAVFLILLAALVGFVVSQYLPYGNWLALGIASFVGVLCIFWQPKTQNGDRTKPVNIWRRFLAFCIDYQVSLAGSIGLILTMSVCAALLFTGRLRGPEEVLELLQSTGGNIFVGMGVWVSFLGYFWVHKRCLGCAAIFTRNFCWIRCIGHSGFLGLVCEGSGYF